MNLNLDFDLLLYGVMLVVLGVVAQQFAPDSGQATLITCVAGGVLAVFWGMLGLRGFRRRLYPIGTLVVLDIALLVLAVKAWWAIVVASLPRIPAAIMLTLLLVFGVMQLVNFLREKHEN